MALAPSRYELLDRIAVGGMAEVFRAKAFGAHGFEKTLAIKKILPELAKDPEFEDRFIAEAKLAVGLSHANVVQVLDFGRFAGTLFIAMELVSGLDLAALLSYFRKRDERVPVPAAFQIAIELVRGLSFAHQNGVVHRDVSPSNILLSEAGEVKIADFGIAVAMREDLGSDEGRIMGKWRYMSPEQTRGGKLSARSDLFSAAVVIYEIFSGEKLFPGDSSKEIIDNIHSMEIPKLSERRPGVPAELDDILAAAFERDVDKRAVSGAEMLRALTEASYKSSLVATSIDVADAVTAALEAGEVSALASPPAGGNIDALIRAQLASAQGAVERRTAVEQGPAEDPALALTDVAAAKAQAADGNTLIKSGVDGRGVTIWELDATVAAGPSARRATGALQALGGEPSTSKREGRDSGRYQQEADSPAVRRGVLYSLLGFGSLMAAVLIFGVFSGPKKRQRADTRKAVDAIEEAPTGRSHLTLDTVPPGATVFIDGVEQPKLTPFQVDIAEAKSLQIEFFLEGYERFEDKVSVSPRENYRLNPRLLPILATLSVSSTPKGAEVYLDGELLGTTDLTRTDLRPGAGRQLEIRLRDHKTVQKSIDLVGKDSVSVSETLRSTLVMGRVEIGIANGWARVSENGKVLGDAPKRFQLSVGKHRLLLHNIHSGQKKSVDVEVFADRIETYVFEL